MVKKEVTVRIGKKFHLEIEDIKDKRLRNGKSKDRVSTAKITNAITRHTSGWKLIKEEIIELNQEDLDAYGKV